MYISTGNLLYVILSTLQENKKQGSKWENRNKPELVHQDTSWCQSDSSATSDLTMGAPVWQENTRKRVRGEPCYSSYIRTYQKDVISSDVTLTSYIFWSFSGFRLSILCRAT